MDDAMLENVEAFFARYDADPALRERVRAAEALYPGSLEIREALVGAVLLPIAAELGLGFTVEALRAWEARKWAARDREEGAQAPDDGGEGYWLLGRGWSNDEARFCGDPAKKRA